MKRTFSTTFFRRALFLVLLFGGVTNLWGDTQIAILDFVYTQVGSEDQSYNICGYFDKDKIILDSDFGWNKGKDDVCNRSNGGEIDSYIMLKNAATACSRKNYTFGGGNLTLTLDTKCKDHNTYTGPTVTIDGKSASFGSITYNNDQEQKTVSVTLEKVSAGTHDISVSFTGSDKFYVKTLTITEATPTTYTVTYDGNNATSGTVPAATVGNGSVTLATNSGNLAKTGYDFSGWNTKSDGTGTSYAVSATYNLTANITLYAKWTIKQHTISYNTGGVGAIGDTKIDDGAVWYAPEDKDIPSNPGYYVKEWRINSAEGAIAVSGEWKPTADATLYLIWAEDLSTEWGIKGDFNEWDYTKNKFEKKSGEGSSNIGYATVTIENAGYYDFKMRRECASSYDCGCATTIHNSVTSYAFCSNVSNNCLLHAVVSGTYEFRIDFTDYNCPSVDITYPDFYTITFDANGHTTLDPLVDGYAIPGGKVAQPTAPRVHNWAFGGWYETPACDGSQFNFNTAINSDKVLYAKWTYSPEQYYYHENGGSTAEPMTLSSDGYFYHIGKAKQNDNRWFKIQSLNKWYGYQQNWPGYNYSNLTTMNSNDNNWGAAENISAINEKNNDYFIIVYIPGTPFNKGENPIICASTALTKNMGDDHKIFFEATDNGAGKWQTPHFRIGRGNNNSSGKNNSATAFLIVPGTDALYYCNSPFYGNYEEFTIANSAGWQGDNSIYQPSETKPTGDYEITHLLSYKGSIPVCEDITYVPATSGSYVSDQGCTYYDYTTTKGMKTQQVTNNGGEHGTVTISFVDVVKDFTGNTTVSDFTSGSKTVAQTCILTITATPEEGYELATNGLVVTGATLKNGQYVVNGTTTVSATFVPKTYALTLDKNNSDAGSTNGSATATYNSTLSNLTHATRTGYTLNGYYTAATDGTKVIAADGTLQANVADYTDAAGKWIRKAATTLYAYWTVNTHKLQWDADGGVLSGEYTYGDAVAYGTAITAPTVSKTGYTFAGWSSEVPATMPDNDVTLTATWNINHYTLTWAGIDGATLKTAGTAAGDVDFGTALTAPVYEKTGYTFDSWNPEVAATMPAAAATYTAQWTAKQYSITLDKNADDGNGGSVKVTYDSNTTTEFSAPARDNYIIEGFYAEQGCTTKVMNADGSLVANVSGYTDNSGNWVKDEACTLYTKWAEKPKVDALIVTGDVNATTKEEYAPEGTLVATNVSDASGVFAHNILEFTFTNITSTYGGVDITPDAGYQQSSSIGATGFGFWYKTNCTLAFTFDVHSGGQMKTELPNTNGAWAYYYFANNNASNWKQDRVTIYVNGNDAGHTTSLASGTFYITEITATEITEKFMNYTVNFDQPSHGTTSAQIKDGAVITSGDEVPEGTQVIFTWNEISGYDFVNFFDGTNTYTQNPCTLTVNSNLTITTTVEVEVPKHTLTVNAGEHGSVSPTSQQVGEGREVIITATPADGYLFDKWTSTGVDLTGHDTDNPLTITMPTNDVTLTATWKVNYCKPYLQLNCVDYDESKVTINDADNKAYIETHDTYATITSGGAIYLPVTLPAGTYYIKVSGRKDNGSVWMNYLTQGTGNNVTYDGDNYGKTNWHDVGSFGNSFEEKTVSWDNQDQNITLNSETKLLFSITGHTNADYEWIRIYKSSGEPFCPEMYTVNFAANPSDKGTITAHIKNGATITTGDEVPENTVVVFTASGIADGYEVVNWTDGSSHQLAGAVNTFEQKITSDTSVTANIALIQPKYTVTATAEEHGTIISGADDYPAGATVTIVTAPATNYKVGSATASNVSEFTIDGNNVSFTMPAEPVAVTVNFVFDEVHNLIATGTSTNVGSQVGSGSSGSITVSSITDPTGHFTHNVLDYNYSMPNSGSYCGYSLPKDADYTPNAKATGLAFWYIADDNVYMEIKTNGNRKVFKLSSTNGEWHYIYLETSEAATATSFEIWMNYSKDSWSMTKSTGHVYFSEIQATNVTSQEPIVPPVNLTVEVSPAGGGSVTTDPETTTGLTKGTPVTLTATPEDNYRFVNWTVGGSEVSTETTYVRTVNATETITANFVRVYTLVVGKDANITEVTGAGQYAEGESVTVTATATQGYKFTNWTAGAGGTELATTSSYTFNMPATDNYTVYANSEVDITYYRITLGTCTNGSIAATVNGKPYEGTDLTANTPVVLTATPNEGYGFVQWTDGSYDNPHTIYANAETQEITWTATFAVRHTVTATFGKPGTEVTGQGEYATGAQVTLEAKWTLESQDFIYGFKEWTDIIGVNLSDEQKVSNPLTFTMPSANASMKATFAPVECVDTYTIQCEDGNASLIENDPKLTLKPFERCNGGGCKAYKDHYTGYHGEGYWDFKEASNMAMYYPVTLEPGTYSFTVWNTTDNVARGCWMYIYTPSETDVVLTYDGQNFKEAAKQNVDFYNSNPAYFGEGGTISNIVIPSRQKVFIALYASDQWSAWDQIVITATKDVFCDEKDIETFTILSTEAKEIPVSGVKNLVVYEGGQATNEDDVEVFETVKYIRSITADNIDMWSTFAVPYTATKTQVSKGSDVDDIYPVYRTEKGEEQVGYYFMEVLTDNNPEAIGIESRARWDMSYTRQPQKDSAYITMFPKSQSNGYFIGSEIFYIGDYKSSGGVTLTGSNKADVENGHWPETGKPKYYYFPNSAITAIYPYDAYVLNEDHTMFVLTDHPTILPFQCYIQATTEFKQMYPRIAIRKKDDGGGVTTELIPISVEEMNAAHVEKFIKDDMIYILRDNKIYTVMGQPVK